MFKITKSEVERVLDGYEPFDQDEDLFYKKINSFVFENDNIFGRNNLEGHITCSAWVIDASSIKVLLIHHKKLNLWFQPGGHVEDEDVSLMEASRREIVEETGINNLQLLYPKIFDIDVHFIPESKGVPGHWHYDVRFLFRALDDSLILNTEELSGIKWIHLSKAIDQPECKNVLRMIQKTQKYMR